SALELPFERGLQPSATLAEKLAQASLPSGPYVKWEVSLAGLRIEQPLLLAGPTLGAVSPNGTFLSLSSEVRSEPLLFKTGSLVTAAPGQYDNTAYVVAENGSLYALSITSSDLVWRFDAEASLF